MTYSDKFEEEFLYALMTKLCSMNVPIVFKGAMVLKVIQYMNNDTSGLERITHDADGDWVGEMPTMEYLTNILQQAVNQLNINFIVIPYREYSDHRSAGFNFVDNSTGDKVTSLDLSVRPNNCMEVYSCGKNISFYGQSINKIIVDKLVVCSSKLVFRRIKDVIDLYILSFNWVGCNTDLIELLLYLNKQLGGFVEFNTKYNELKHVYSKYHNKAATLDFDIIYKRAKVFMQPFICRVKDRCRWDGSKWVMVGGYTKICN